KESAVLHYPAVSAFHADSLDGWIKVDAIRTAGCSRGAACRARPTRREVQIGAHIGLNFPELWTIIPEPVEVSAMTNGGKRPEAAILLPSLLGRGRGWVAAKGGTLPSGSLRSR